MQLFLRHHSESFGDRCGDGAFHVLSSAGLEALTLGRVSAAMSRSRSTLHLQAGGREGLLRMIVRNFGGRWSSWSQYPPGEDLLSLPETDHDVTGTRVWAALRELAAGEARSGRPGCAQCVAGIRLEETKALTVRLAQRLGRRPTSEEVTATYALIEGLRAAVTSEVDPLPVALARQLVADSVRRMARGQEPIESPA